LVHDLADREREGGIVLDEQEEFFAGRDRGTVVGARLGVRLARRGSERQVAEKRAAGAERALELKLAAEERRQLARDREAQTGAAVLAVGASVDLLEGLEDAPLVVGRDPRAAVANDDRERVVGAQLRLAKNHAARRARDAQGDSPLAR